MEQALVRSNEMEYLFWAFFSYELRAMNSELS
jgi:hypothetical protein